MLGREYWLGKKVLVTGGLGFIGYALCNRLKSLGANVFAMSSYVPCNSHFFPVLIGDVRDYASLCHILSINEIDIVYHFAASSIVKISASDPRSTYDTNVMGTVNVLDAARCVGSVKRIVVASSDKAYGDHDILPYVEDFALSPKNTYDTSKACMDMIARTYAKNYDMPIVVTRCSNVYGPGDRNYTRLIPNTIRRVLLGKQPMLYSDVENMQREFIFIEDVIDAYVELGNDDIDFNGEVFNVGGNGPMPIISVVNKILELMLCDYDPLIMKRVSFFKEIEKQYIDASKLNEYTGWSPRTDFDVGIEKTIKWYEKDLFGFNKGEP